MPDRIVVVIKITNAQANALWRAAKDWLNGPCQSINGEFEENLDLAMEALETRASLQPDEDAIMRAYATYDSDLRVNGPDDFEAFSDAVREHL